MNRNGPILIIEDDMDDRDSILLIYQNLNCSNELVFLEDGDTALAYLNNMTVAPFIIISDINMPKMDGLQLRQSVFENENINFLCIPYIILSTTVDKIFVDKAYSTGIQGYFQKPVSFTELEKTLRTIIEYWKSSYSPGNYIPDNFAAFRKNK